MDGRTDMSPEELQRQLEEAKRKLQEQLDKMTPEERQEAERKAQQLIAEDKKRMQDLVNQAAAVAAGVVPAGKAAPNFCTNCGSPVNGGKFCTSCGHPLG